MKPPLDLCPTTVEEAESEKVIGQSVAANDIATGVAQQADDENNEEHVIL